LNRNTTTCPARWGECRCGGVNAGAADEFDRTGEDDFTTSRLMLWREEQRAIGELMRHAGDEPRCVSFNSFAADYDSCFSRWFATFASHLDAKSASRTNMLGELQRVLERLVRQLDVERVLVDVDERGRVTRPLWAAPANLPKVTRHTKRTSLQNRG
jgi:hypothetical protein